MTSSRDDVAPSVSLYPRVLDVDVQTKVATFSFPCRDDESLLTAGLAAGYDLPYECSTGTCGSCHARVAAGSVDPGWTDAPGYAKLHLDKGDVLMCQARPRSDCAIKVRSSAIQPEPLAPRLLRRTGRVESVRRLTRDVLQFDLALSQPIDFEAGQFVGLRHKGVVGHRAYSMVNHGPESRNLTFVVKRKPKGLFSDAIFDQDLTGHELDVVGPLGRATFRPDDNRNFICIAGGSGIAGMMAILAHARQADHYAEHKGHVFFGVRTRADAFYVAEFAESVAAASGSLKVVIAISDEDEVEAAHPEFPDVAMAKGLVHQVAAAEMRGRWSDEVAFVAGPQPMVDAAIRMLITEARMKPGDIRFDKFS